MALDPDSGTATLLRMYSITSVKLELSSSFNCPVVYSVQAQPIMYRRSVTEWYQLLACLLMGTEYGSLRT